MILRTHTKTMVILLAEWLWLVFCIESVAGTACSSSPCEGGGTCVSDYNNNYYCQCPADRTGDNCEQLTLALFPQLEIYEGTQTISKDHHFFSSLINQHQGYLTGVTFYARQAGTFWLDLWKNNGSEPEAYTLVFSKSFTVTTTGQNNMDISPSVAIEQGLTVGVHSSTSLANPLAVTGGAGYLVWRTSWLEDEGEFVVGTTTLTSSDNTDTVPVYMVPSIQLHIEQPDLITWYPTCTAQQETDVIDRPSGVGTAGHIFVGLTTPCSGWLHAISIYTTAAGTVYIDLWKDTDSGNNYVLMFTKKITVSGPGKFTLLIDEVVYVEEGLTYGTHRPRSTINAYVLEHGKTSPDEPSYNSLRYLNRHEDIAWTPNVLHSSRLTFISNIDWKPSIAIHIRNTTSRDNTDTLPINVEPSLIRYIQKPESVTWYPGCSSQQEYEVIDRHYHIGKGVQIFMGLQTKCAGRLSAISIYVLAAGTVYVDLWKETNSGTDHVLFFTKGIIVSGPGKFTVLIDEVVYVEEGLTYGTHRPQSDINTYVLEDGKTSPDQQTYNTLQYDYGHEDLAWTPDILYRSHLTPTTPTARRPSIAIHIEDNDIQECGKGRSSPPLIPGPAEPPSGLTIIPGVNTSCAATVNGLSFYASVAGSFYVAMFKSLSDSDTYSLSFKEKVSVDEPGLHHVTLQNQYFLKQDDVLGIFDDALSPNALRYVENTELLKSAMEYDNNMPAAHRLELAAEDVTVNSPSIIINEATSTTVHFPPLQLHLEYGSVYHQTSIM